MPSVATTAISQRGAAKPVLFRSPRALTRTAPPRVNAVSGFVYHSTAVPPAVSVHWIGAGTMQSYSSSRAHYGVGERLLVAVGMLTVFLWFAFLWLTSYPWRPTKEGYRLSGLIHGGASPGAVRPQS